MEKKFKEFSIAKWFVFPGMTIALSAILATFNIKVFGLNDAIPSLVMIGVIAAFSIMICKFTGSRFRHIRITAFGIEFVLLLAFGISAAYALSVQREMSMATQVQKSNQSTIQEIAKLDRRAQRNISKSLEFSNENQITIFSKFEDWLFYLLLFDFFAYATGAFALLGMTHLYVPESSTKDHEISMKLPENSSKDHESSMNFPETSKEFSMILEPSRANFRTKKSGSSKKFHNKNPDLWFTLISNSRGTRIYDESNQYKGFAKPDNEPLLTDYESIRKFITAKIK